MRRALRLAGSLVGLVVIGTMLAALALVFGGRLGAGGQPQRVQQPYPPPAIPAPGAYPAPLTPTPEQPPAGPPPTPTLHPRSTIYPTVPPLGPTPTPFSPLPTPVVTPIPTAVPPIIPLPPGPAQPYTIAFRDGNVIRAIESNGTDERVLIDIHARLPLFLGGGGVEVWGSPSPDGNQLALVLSNVAELPRKGEAPEYSIFLLDLTTRVLRPLVQGGVEPVWSPDGTRIAYRGPTSGLWVADVTTGKAREIYAVDRENEHFATNFNWSPNGEHLVFVDKVFRGPAAIMVIDADGVSAATVPMSSTAYPPNLPRWSPDGNKILFVSLAGELSGPLDSYNLWSMSFDGTDQIQLTHGLSLSGGQPHWSPDGRWIVFTGTRYYEEPEPLTDLWLVDSSGSDLKRLTSNAVEATNELSPAWSPDGTQIVFMRGAGDIWTISLADGTQTRLTLATSDFILLR